MLFHDQLILRCELKVKEKITLEVLDLLNESLGALIFDRDSNDAIDR